MKRLLRQWKLYRMGLDAAPWQRWKVVCDDCRKYLTSGCMKLTLTRIGAVLWAKRHVPADRTYRVIRHTPNSVLDRNDPPNEATQ